MPSAAWAPVLKSTQAYPDLVGAVSGNPVKLIAPDSAWAMVSKQGRLAYGPVEPNPETLATMIAGLNWVKDS